MSRPIPKRLLIHSAVLKKGPITDADENVTGYETEIPLNYVRFEFSSELLTGTAKAFTENKPLFFSGTMFYDCKNSDPSDVVFAEQDVVVFEDDEFSVLGQTVEYDEIGRHHIEVKII